MNAKMQNEIRQNAAMNLSTIPIRVAGGDPRLARDQIQDVLGNDVISIKILTHSDCKYRAARFDSISRTGMDLDPRLLTPAGSKFNSMEHFETQDNGSILTYVKDLVKGRGISDIQLEQVPVEALTRKPEGVIVPHILAVMKPDNVYYELPIPAGIYFLTSTRGLDQVTSTQALFFVKNRIVEDIRFLPPKDAEEETTKQAEQLRVAMLAAEPARVNSVRIAVDSALLRASD
jgi:hypothetical protein